MEEYFNRDEFMMEKCGGQEEGNAYNPKGGAPHCRSCPYIPMMLGQGPRREDEMEPALSLHSNIS